MDIILKVLKKKKKNCAICHEISNNETYRFAVILFSLRKKSN